MINEEKLDRALLDLGFSDFNRGTAYLRESIKLCGMRPDIFLTKEVYPTVAKEHGTTGARAERCMRHAIETAWMRGGGEVQFSIFGYSVDPNKGKPTTGEFIARMVRYCNEN